MQVTDETSKKNKGGRPKKDPAKLRTHQVRFYMTESEHVTIKAAAEEAGMSIPDYLMICSTAGINRFEHEDGEPPIVPAINMEWSGNLARLSGLLNQIAYHAHIGNFTDGKEIISTCSQLHTEVKSIRKLLTVIK